MKLWKKILLIALAVENFFLFAALCINGFVVTSTAKRILPAEEAVKVEDAACILVLGCGVRPDGTPSAMLEDRLKQGIALYNVGAAPKLLMSGDHGQESYDEVNVMRQYALNAGVPSADIFMDHAGFSTYESIYRARDIFGAKKIIIVTQRYQPKPGAAYCHIAGAGGLRCIRGFAGLRRTVLSGCAGDSRPKQGFCYIYIPTQTYLFGRSHSRVGRRKPDQRLIPIDS